MITLRSGHDGTARRPWRLLLAVLVGVGLFLPRMGGAQALEGTVAVGNSTLAYSSGWEVLAEDGHNVTLRHRDLRPTFFDYSVTPDNAFGTSDPADLIQAARVDSVKELDVVEDFALVGAGTLADGARWELYRLQVNGVNAFYLVAARVDAGPGVDVVTSLLTTMRDLVAAHLSVAAGITVDGAPTPIAEIGIETLLPLAWEAIEEAGWGPGRIAVPEPNP